MKQLLAVTAMLAAHVSVFAQAAAADEAPGRAPSVRPGPPPLTPGVSYPRITTEPATATDPASQMRDLQRRVEALDKRVAELEKKNPPAPTPTSDRPEPARLRALPR